MKIQQIRSVANKALKARKMAVPKSAKKALPSAIRKEETVKISSNNSRNISACGSFSDWCGGGFDICGAYA